MRSYEDSLQRLGMNKIDILVIHDLDGMHFPDVGIAHHMGQLYTGGIYALEELKAAGEIQAYGAGINHTGTMTRYLVSRHDIAGGLHSSQDASDMSLSTGPRI